MASDGKDKWPRQVDAHEYLKNHRILDLFDNFTAQLIYNKPEDPKKFLIDQLEKLKNARTTKLDFPCLFDESNIRSIFGMLDPTERGYITLQQYKEALMTLGVTDLDQHPAGGELDRINLDTFTREAKRGLARASATFEESK
ncbi:EF-hand calcium-binding domain-containing protein 10 [Lingula anatina]|uniref:EF-hand calcium-binding domain-containing protein 10 n=1 Tax=Lingula anatina TaxID=7574 RepID=A0A1S3JY57_LINAN|nr:EF-hand calcium-binding domain-containing protein 10 [Lingula anatina]|eukprot:XP_013415242.1 EF-hand calcium-binding domain-containing protein 10 [Lingula anatina]